jgi:23S rRNA pseudouridine1911/1915/1917 synthase
VDRLIYIDERILVIDKPPGTSLATPKSDPQAAAARLLGVLPPETNLAYGLTPGAIHLVHRLDIGTSGLVLAARDEDAHRELSRAISEHRIVRTYLAIVWGHPRPPEGVYDSPLAPDRRDRRRMKADAGGRPARTRYWLRLRLKHVSLLQIVPETGRTHQIRVHLAAAGHPIVGDDLYAGARHRAVRNPCERAILTPSHTLLHAWRMQLPENTVTDVRFLEAPLPADFTRVPGFQRSALLEPRTASRPPA